MINFANIKQALYNVVKKNLGVQVIWAEQSEARPERPYASMRLLTGPQVVANDEVRQPESGKFAVAGLRQMALSVNCFGHGSIELMSKLQTALSKDSVAEELNSSGIAVIDAGQVQNLTGLLDNRFETRAQMDIQFYVSENEVDDVGPIESVEITDEVQDEDFTVEV